MEIAVFFATTISLIVYIHLSDIINFLGGKMKTFSNQGDNYGS